MNEARAIRIFLVEDNEGDVFLAKKALSVMRHPVQFDVQMDGEKVLSHLKDCVAKGVDSTPDLIFLDLNLPKVNGLEVLRSIKLVENLRSIPIVILSSSRSPQDVSAVYAAGANSYLPKPKSIDDFRKMAEVIERFWFDYAILPTKT